VAQHQSKEEARFCQVLLRATMVTVRRVVPVAIQKEAWAYRYGTSLEFHVPSKQFYWYGDGCCVAHAKDAGWTAYLAKFHPGCDEDA
jgi:hypothetical protein